MKSTLVFATAGLLFASLAFAQTTAQAQCAQAGVVDQLLLLGIERGRGHGDGAG